MNFVPAGYPPGPFQPVPQPQVFHTVMVPQFAQPLPPQQQPTGLHQPLIPTQLHQPLIPQKAAPPKPQNSAPTFHALPSASGLIKSTRKYKNFNLLFLLFLFWIPDLFATPPPPTVRPEPSQNPNFHQVMAPQKRSLDTSVLLANTQQNPFFASQTIRLSHNQPQQVQPQQIQQQQQQPQMQQLQQMQALQLHQALLQQSGQVPLVLPGSPILGRPMVPIPLGPSPLGSQNGGSAINNPFAVLLSPLPIYCPV